MNYNKPDTKLDECIYVAKNIIPAELCDSIVQNIETREWSPHRWYNGYTDKSHSEETMELDVQSSTPELQKKLTEYIIQVSEQYNQNYALGNNFVFYNLLNQSKSEMVQIIKMLSTIRFNRYKPGQIMRQHVDHIHSLFDGKVKGVPLLSFILNFNDDYEGADLYFWEDTIVQLGKGDICMFPSNFLFPHGVTEATKGKRYSGVCWGW